MIKELTGSAENRYIKGKLEMVFPKAAQRHMDACFKAFKKSEKEEVFSQKQRNCSQN